MMKIKYSFLLVILAVVLVASSCKKDPKANASLEKKELSAYAKDSLQVAEKLRMSGEEVTPEKINKILSASPKKKDSNRLPKACDLVKAKLVADEFDVREANIIVSDGKRRANGGNNSASCFWRWTGGGVLVQVNRNPMPDEIPNWTEKYMEAKKSRGESNIEEGKTVKYSFEEFDGPGTENLCSHKLGRYYSVYKDKFVVSVMFNNNMESRKQLSIAKKMLNSAFANMD